MNREVTNIKIFFTGAIGSIAPQILDWYARGIEIPDLNTKLIGAIFISLIFMSLAGYIAVIWGEKNLMKVFFIGIGTPSIILSAADNITYERPVPEIPSQVVMPSSGSLNTNGDKQNNYDSLFFLGQKKAYALELGDGMLVAEVQNTGELELILDFESAESGEVLKGTNVLLKNIRTSEVLAKIKPEAPHVKILYFTGVYDVVVEVIGFSADPKSSRVEIKTGEKAKAEFKLKPLEKGFTYHINQFFEGVKGRFKK